VGVVFFLMSEDNVRRELRLPWVSVGSDAGTGPAAAGDVRVFVNGVAVLRDGEHTGARPGRALKGPGAARRP
jgi:hypothetical protein